MIGLFVSVGLSDFGVNLNQNIYSCSYHMVVAWGSGQPVVLEDGEYGESRSQDLQIRNYLALLSTGVLSQYTVDLKIQTVFR